MAMFVNGTGSPFPTGTNPVSNAAADLDGDGDVDLLTANYISDNASVLLNNGSGVLVAGAPVAVGNGPRQIHAGDLDGDGDIDFITSNYAANSVSVRLNNGHAVFSSGGEVAVGTVPRGLALGDLDGDGDLDFVSANYTANTVSVRLNNGSGVFVAAGSAIAVGTHPIAIALADLDGDGDRDMAITNNSNNNVSILLNNGTGSFVATAPAATGAGPRGITAGDFDGDGDRDLVVANFSANTLSILLNNGSGVFTAGTPLATQNNPYAVTVGDLDGDGDLDIASTNSGSSSVNVFLNNGAGTFTPANGAPFAVGVSPGGIVTGDFDHDGDLDLSTANFGSSTAQILINNAVHAPAGTSATIIATEDTTRVLLAADFGFSDVDSHAFIAVRITTLPGAGGLTNNGVAVVAGDLITIADINAGKLAFKPAPNGNGAAYTAFTFQVKDDGNLVDGGVNLDQSPNTLTFNVAAVDDPPTGVTLGNVHAPIAETISTATAIKVADIAIADGDSGPNAITLTGEDAGLFEVAGTELRLRAGADLDYRANPILSVQINVDGVGVGGVIDAFTTLTLDVVEVMVGTGRGERITAAGTNGEIILGKRGDDIIKGRRGDDHIVGGKGADTMTGGADADSFVFKSINDTAANQTGLIGGRFTARAGEDLRDVITDFHRGLDHLDFSAMDADATLAGNQAFRWGNTRSFTDIPGKLIGRRYDEAGTAHDKTIIYGDNDGDGKADFQVELKGLLHLTAADFVL